MIQPPCKDCAERHSACWSDCPSYKLWSAEQKGMLSERRKEHAAAGLIYDGYQKRKEPYKKK